MSLRQGKQLTNTMENFKSFNQRLEEGLTSESVDTEISNIVESSLRVLKNDLWDKEDKKYQLEYRKKLLETLREKLDHALFDQKYGDIQTAIDLIDSEIDKLRNMV